MAVPPIITLNEAILINGLLSMGNGCPAVKRPGFKIMLPCGLISQVTTAELQYFIRLFGGNLGGNGGVAGLTGSNLGNPSYPPNPIFSPPGLPPIFGTGPNNVVHTGTTQGTLPLLPPPPPPLPPPSPPPCIDCIRTLPHR